jgi:FAD/FMN-containing dehydrogenase
MVGSWGRLGSWDHEVRVLSDRSGVARGLEGAGPGIARGMGRSYGDCCLNPNGVLWSTVGLDRFITFDESTGMICCESGVLLRDIQGLAIPRGWTLPVTPGTQVVTVGGAIANDVHGKNHHVHGSFGSHVERLGLARTDGTTIECGPGLLPDWFAATVGGLGLTGVITHATIQLQRTPGPWFTAQTIPYGNLDEFFDLADGSETAWEHTVSWVDCLWRGGARGLFLRGNAIDAGPRALPRRRALAVPFVPPLSPVNTLSLRTLNGAYFRFGKARGTQARLVHYEQFLYPLDNVLEWNRLYGPRGFYQYQCVVPREAGRDAVQAMLAEISRIGEGSFLAVLKTFGQRPSAGMIGFAQPGVTLALDFPNKGPRTLRLFERLDAIVRNARGRLYPAKDARMAREMFEAGYPRLAEFLKYRDPGISSSMSRRLMGS